MDDLLIRESEPGDWSDIETLYAEAFPDEDLVPLVAALLGNGPPVVSLVGVDRQTVIAHAIFTLCDMEDSGEKAALLGPLAVAPRLQRKGYGSRIVRFGLQQLKAGGIAGVFVLGDPAYYQKFGFEKSVRVTPPYPMPDEWDGAWQVLLLADDKPLGPGRLLPTGPWRRPELWAP